VGLEAGREGEGLGAGSAANKRVAMQLAARSETREVFIGFRQTGL
jgi:hypothetical protein